MSDETKAKAQDKWEKCLPKIGYPDSWRDWSGLTLTPDSYYADVMAAARAALRTKGTHRFWEDDVSAVDDPSGVFATVVGHRHARRRRAASHPGPWRSGLAAC